MIDSMSTNAKAMARRVPIRCEENMGFADQKIIKRYFKAIIIRCTETKGEAMHWICCFKETKLRVVRGK
jgi:hypothetical protein